MKTIDERILRMANIISRRERELEDLKKKHQQVLNALRDFTSVFYAELDKILFAITKEGLGKGQEGDKKDLPFNLKSYSFEGAWVFGCEMKAIIYPSAFIGYPNPCFWENRFLPEEWGRKLVGQIILFLQADTVSPHGALYVFPEGYWCGSGIFPQKLRQSYSAPLLEEFSLLFLERLCYASSVLLPLPFWREVELNPDALSKMKIVQGFRLKEEEEESEEVTE